jgi:hypothetical protein
MTKNRNQKKAGDFSQSTKKKTDITPQRHVPSSTSSPQVGIYLVSSVTSTADGKVDGGTKLSDLKPGFNFSVNQHGDFGGVLKIL